MSYNPNNHYNNDDDGMSYHSYSRYVNHGYDDHDRGDSYSVGGQYTIPPVPNIHRTPTPITLGIPSTPTRFVDRCQTPIMNLNEHDTVSGNNMNNNIYDRPHSSSFSARYVPPSPTPSLRQSFHQFSSDYNMNNNNNVNNNQFTKSYTAVPDYMTDDRAFHRKATEILSILPTTTNDDSISNTNTNTSRKASNIQTMLQLTKIMTMKEIKSFSHALKYRSSKLSAVPDEIHESGVTSMVRHLENKIGIQLRALVAFMDEQQEKERGMYDREREGRGMISKPPLPMRPSPTNNNNKGNTNNMVNVSDFTRNIVWSGVVAEGDHPSNSNNKAYPTTIELPSITTAAVSNENLHPNLVSQNIPPTIPIFYPIQTMENRNNMAIPPTNITPYSPQKQHRDGLSTASCSDTVSSIGNNNNNNHHHQSNKGKNPHLVEQQEKNSKSTFTNSTPRIGSPIHKPTHYEKGAYVPPGEEEVVDPTRRIVQVIAPETLPEYYAFDARIGDDIFIAVVVRIL